MAAYMTVWDEKKKIFIIKKIPEKKPKPNKKPSKSEG